MMRGLILISVLIFCLLNSVHSQWGNGGGWNNGYGNYGPGGGYGGGYGGNGWRGGYGGGFGSQQAYNVQNAARIGTEVAEGVLVAEEVSEALG
ncbi:hypothetical protein GCK72_021763 [Caenorhabditis remanei]|uniref:Uncharacterized protein n=1 Tax=Caenorhabditis remanei TaxID=31234 RepID=A0A6A5GKF9_CAERE|nr:hypothetical protein GCK72_021763 [Caenorhabditis remanei]KAF1755194.1 hypothetical protein GCK72_021763 [Caenorhabditis remanei]